MNKIELERLTDIRIKEAEVLLKADCYHGAYYLAGYALECTLKACIAKQVKAFDFPDKDFANKCYTHKLTELLITARLNQDLSQKEKQDFNFRLNWALVKEWSEKSRYDTAINKQDADSLFNAITDNQSGILPWLKNYL